MKSGTPSSACLKLKYFLFSLGPKESNQNWLLTNADLAPFIPLEADFDGLQPMPLAWPRTVEHGQDWVIAACAGENRHNELFSILTANNLDFPNRAENTLREAAGGRLRHEETSWVSTNGAA